MKNTIKTCHASHTEHPKKHYYSLVIDLIVSTIFISEHFEKASLKNLKLFIRIYEKINMH